MSLNTLVDKIQVQLLNFIFEINLANEIFVYYHLFDSSFRFELAMHVLTAGRNVTIQCPSKQKFVYKNVLGVIF